MMDPWRSLVLPAAISILLVVAVSAQPPGAAAEGHLALGDLGTDSILSIDAPYPAGADLKLVRGTTAKAYDSITISSDGDWTLEVADAGGTNTDSPGKMEEYDNEAYVASGADLANKLEILVDGIGGNSALQRVTLTDVKSTNDLSDTVNYRTFAEGTGMEGDLTVDLEYSQLVDPDDAMTKYRINLIYKLSNKVPE